MWFSKGKANTPRVVQAPMSADETRLIAAAEAEFREHPQPLPDEEEDMPVGIFFPFLRRRNGLSLKPLTVNGSFAGRVSDDVNAAIAENELLHKRSPNED